MSNINPNNIDGTFPIAGQDNSSQGFRDNFTNIRNNFSYAQSELGDLQAKALVTTALTGQALNNVMSYTPIVYPQLTGPSYTLYDWGTPSSGSTLTLDYSVSSFQKLTTNGSYTLGFANFPYSTGSSNSVQIAVMTLWVHISTAATISGTGNTLTLPITSPGVTIGLNDIPGSNTSTGILTFDTPGDYFLQFTSRDGGQNIAITDLSRNYASLRDPDLYWNDAVTTTLLVGYGTNQSEFQTILSYETGQDAVSAHGSYNSVTAGNLALGNVSYPYIDTGAMGGYSVSSLRGNLQTSTLTQVNNGDYLGYLNAITYTGSTGVGNPTLFQQVSTIGFYASGGSQVTGLGGNIAMFTHAPATTSNLVVQALGIENDQSTHVYGNLFLGQLGSTNANSAYVPPHSTSTGTVGQIAWSTASGTTYFYVCVASNTWNRVQLNSTTW